MAKEISGSLAARVDRATDGMSCHCQPRAICHGTTG